jgi:type IV pilus assembly protein PilX
MMLMKNKSFRKQSGAVLVVSLIMLLLLTLIGVAGTQVSGLEEKMANNSRDQNLSFQAAEAALRAAEEMVLSKDTTAEFLSSLESGLFSENESLPNYFDPDTWENEGSFLFDSGIEEITTQPRYFIKYVKDSTPTNIGSCSYGQGAKCGVIVSYFIVTARGTGAMDTSQSYLRLYYGKNFN